MQSTNHFAVVVAAIVFFALGAGWYTVLADPWAAGIGKTMDQLHKETGGSFMPMVMGFVAILVMCYTLSSLLNRLGDTTAAGGAKVGAFASSVHQPSSVSSRDFVRSMWPDTVHTGPASRAPGAMALIDGGSTMLSWPIIRSTSCTAPV